MRRTFLLVLVAACGGGGETPPNPPDCILSCDQPPPPPVAPIALRIVNGSSPVAGVRVIFVEQDGFGQTFETTTDSQGIAQITTQHLTTVTAINPFGPLPDGREDIRTLVGAAPFDTLQIDKPRSEEITVDVVAPADPDAARYELHTTCGSAQLASETGQATLRDCNGFADVIWMALAADGTPLREIAMASLVVENGSTISLPNSYVTVPEHRIEYSGVPVGADRISSRALVRLTSRGVVLARDFETTISSGVGTGRVLLPNAISGETIIDSQLPRGTGDITTHGVFDINPPSTGTRQFIDLFNVELPKVLSRPELNQAQTISWTEEAFAAAVVLESSVIDAPVEDRIADFVVFELSVTRGEQRFRRQLILPYQGGGTVAVPAAGEFSLQLDDTVTIDRMLLAKSSVGYSFHRPTLLSSQRVQDLSMGTGRIVYQEL